MKSRILMLITAAFLGIVGNSKAQKCESIKDPFTGTEKTVYNYPQTGPLVFRMELEADGSAIFSIKDADMKVVDTPIPAGTPFLILLEGGEILELALMEECQPKSGSIASSYQGAGSGFSYTEWVQKMKLTKDQINAMSQKKVTHLKYKKYDGTETIFDCKKDKVLKLQKKLMEAAKCMAGTK